MLRPVENFFIDLPGIVSGCHTKVRGCSSLIVVKTGTGSTGTCFYFILV